MTRSIPCRNLRWPVLALLILLLGGCAFPELIVIIHPNDLVLVQGDNGTVIVTTTEDPSCEPVCVDTSGQVFDFVVQNLPEGVTHSIDTRLQSPGTPGVVRITFEAGAGAVPGWYSAVVHAVLAGRSLGSAPLALNILPVTSAVSAEPVSIAAGGSHSLAALADGSVLAWGDNDDGQLGVGSSRGLPVVVRNLDGIVGVAAGLNHSLALTANGLVWVWGRNVGGLLADGDRSDRLVPVQVQGIHNVRAIAAGASHSLALRIPADSTVGTVWAWGGNFYGQLGDGTTTSRAVPVQVQGLSAIQAIAAGGFHSLALAADGTVWAWGRNSSGQLGDGTIEDRPVRVPVQVQGLSAIRDIAAGGVHSLALQDCGQLWAWGANYNGQLGVGIGAERPRPVPVFGIGGDSTCDPVGLRVTLAGDGRGAVTSPDADLDCTGVDCIAILGRGTAVNLTASTSAGSVFEGWAIDCPRTDSQIQVFMDRSKHCAARFRSNTPEPFLLTVLNGGGRVTSTSGGILGPDHIVCGETCNAIFPPNTLVTLSAADANGFDFTGWAFDCSGTAAEARVTMDGPRTCRADFRPFDLGVSVTGSG
ncbi:MAG: RCC1 domain-containing protein, partial [Gemmatimonadales bacterium]